MARTAHAPKASVSTSAFASPEQLVEAARDGKMFILVDHEDRENEGDLVIAAEKITPEAINFMAKYARGLICMPMERARVDALNLPQMSSSNTSRHETAFTVSIEAREGVTTGISAHDRAHTIKVATDPNCHSADIATPGHIFPLCAKDGGVLVRAGHTEAAVDISRLAGLVPASVICEIMNDDGTMARMPDLMEFAATHELLIGTIADLIAFRLKNDNLVREKARSSLNSFIGGKWDVYVFEDAPDGAEHVVIAKGDISNGEPVLTRMHVLDPFEDLLALNSLRWNQVPDSMVEIAREGRGALVILRDGSKDVLSSRFNVTNNPRNTLRRYGIGAQILCNIGIQKIVLLTNSTVPSLVGLDSYDLSIIGTRPIPRVCVD
ncbi:3,4-dihydroxy-2-butanone-4-phosphate synthase [Pseudohalocynthiibacter aestuariivivens]|nr:3,4-dihydroxy-2-butanone-4-phosphate synthase [Pseudohalocynthiibacter aestuariivivens]QIE45202.1 3,4-dihydroxy-2-butanone-4-phosphate synthase [Pseudohalocynthiibacter aestuariivivens]